MRTLRVLPFLLALALVSPRASAAGGDEGRFDARTRQSIESSVATNLKAYGAKQPVPGAVVGVWYPGHGSFVKGIGFGNLAPRAPMATADAFRIGSNTKTFVISVLLQLVDEKKLGLDDPVNRFRLGLKVPNGDRITVRQLMEMRSGIIDLYASPAFQRLDLTPNGAFDRKHWIEVALAHPPLFPPGTKYNYSNTNYMLLGMIAEKLTHDTIEHQIERRLIAPFGLRATIFPTTDPNMPAPFAHGYMPGAGGKWEDMSVVLPPSVSWAAGAMISNLSDMKTWVKAYVSGATNSRATQLQRLACIPIGEANMSFGLGIGCSAGWYGYTGGITGYNTGAYYFPAKDATIIALVNTQREPKGKRDVASAIVRDIAGVLFPENVPFR